MPAYRMHPDRKDVEALRSLRRRLHAAALALGLTIVISTLGLLVLGRHGEQAFGTRLLLAFWDTLNLVSTIGNLQEEFTLGQRLWAIVVILFGLGAALFGFSTLQALIQEDFVRLYARRKMKKTLEGLDGHVIVCGYGQVGRAVVDDLLSGDVPHVVIDNDEDIVDAAEASDVLAIHGDCTRDETLDTAGVHRASGLVATLNSDAANVFLILVARELNPSLRIVARAEREESCARIRRAGANQVIVPSDIAGFRLSGMIRKPNISEFMDEVVYGSEYEFAEVAVRSYPGLDGRSIGELDFARTADTIIISVITGDRRHIFNPRGEHVLRLDDVMLVVSRGDGLSVLNAFAEHT